MTEIREDEYLDPADGLIHCCKCGGPRQAVMDGKTLYMISTGETLENPW